jgi:hypothetical protein
MKIRHYTISRALILSAIMLLAFAGFAAKLSAPPVNNPTPEKTLRDFLKFPQVLVPQIKTKSAGLLQKVEVLFITGKSGAVNFAFAKTDNKQLKSEIEKQFLNLSFEKLKADVVHSVTLSFKTI